MEEQIIEQSFQIIQPVIESSIILAGEYMKKCGRTILTGEDMEYAMKYCARNVVGKHIGTMFPEIEQDADSDEEYNSDEECDEEDDPFTRYQGDDTLMNDVNTAHDTWKDWEPSNPTERMLKNSIDSRYESHES